MSFRFRHEGFGVEPFSLGVEGNFKAFGITVGVPLHPTGLRITGLRCWQVRGCKCHRLERVGPWIWTLDSGRYLLRRAREVSCAMHLCDRLGCRASEEAPDWLIDLEDFGFVTAVSIVMQHSGLRCRAIMVTRAARDDVEVTACSGPPRNCCTHVGQNVQISEKDQVPTGNFKFRLQALISIQII